MIGKIEMAADCDGGGRLAGQRADHVAGMLFDGLLLHLAAGVMEKIADGGLAVAGGRQTGFETGLYDGVVNEIDLDVLRRRG